jgi:hypothetical protein
VTAVALRLHAEYAPPRPVRLLGVRVAGLSSGAPDTKHSGEPDAVRGQAPLPSDDRPQLSLLGYG